MSLDQISPSLVHRSDLYREPSPKWDPTVPSHVRCEIIREYARQHRQCRTFVESGSADGDTTLAVKDSFEHLHTVEIVPTVQANTVERLRPFPNIHCYLGDTTEVFPQIIRQVQAPCLWWLDGHYCGSLEARGEKDTPVIEEITMILATGMPHVILIDDARLFGVDPAYPSIEWVRGMAHSQQINMSFSYADDVMRIVPR